MPLTRLQPLTSDYWPATERSPYLRLAIAFVAAPLPYAATIIGFAWYVYTQTETDPREALNQTQELTAISLIATYGLVFLAGISIFPLLWSLRLRSAIWYLGGGLVLGTIVGVIAGLFEGGLSIIGVAFFAIAGAIPFLCFRWFAGIRRLETGVLGDMEFDFE